MDKVLSPGDATIVRQRMNTNRQDMEKTFEQRLHDDLHRYLLGMKVVDERLPECPDVEGRWKQLIEAYLPDGIREFAAYPTVSLGWMMFIGMAIAYMWDKDWMRYNADPQLYELLRDARGYDAMDDQSWRMCSDSMRMDAEKHRTSWRSVPRAPIICCVTNIYSLAPKRLFRPIHNVSTNSISWEWPCNSLPWATT